MRQAARVALLALALAALPAGPAAAGTLTRGAIGPNPYVVYTPSSYTAARPAPLVVMLHGCGTAVDVEVRRSRWLPVAAARGFVVLFADGDPTVRRRRCWNYDHADSQVRGSGDPALIVAMVREVMRTHAIDPGRVYAAGSSSGAMMTDILGATYPDVFAALAMHGGCAYRAGRCITTPPDRSSRRLAREAYAAMGDHARPVPVLVLHGTADPTVPFAHLRQVVAQWLGTDARASGPGGLAVDKARRTARASSYRATVRTYVAGRCPLVESWAIHGMAHVWPGSTGDPHARHPNGAQLAWRFFTRTRRGCSTV